MHRGDDGFVRFALLDALVDAFLDEDSFQRAEVEFVLELFLLEFQLALEQADELLGVFAQDFAHGHFHRAIVADHDDAAGDGDFAIGEGVERINQFFGIDALRAFDFDLDFFRREIVDGFDLQLAFARRVFDGADERFGGGGGRDFLDQRPSTRP